MKEGRTPRAPQFEPAVDRDTGVVGAVTGQTMDGGNPASRPETLDEAERLLAEVGVEAQEGIADQGYHSNRL